MHTVKKDICDLILKLFRKEHYKKKNILDINNTNNIIKNT